MNENDNSSIEELKVLITADTSDLKKKVEDVKKSLNGFNNSTNKLNIDVNSSGIKSTVNTIKRGVAEGVTEGVTEALTSSGIKEGASHVGDAVKGAISGATQGVVSAGIGKKLADEMKDSVEESFGTIKPVFQRAYKSAMESIDLGDNKPAQDLRNTFKGIIEAYKKDYSTAAQGFVDFQKKYEVAMEQLRNQTGKTSFSEEEIPQEIKDIEEAIDAAYRDMDTYIQKINDYQKAYNRLSESMKKNLGVQQEVNEAMQGAEVPETPVSVDAGAGQDLDLEEPMQEAQEKAKSVTSVIGALVKGVGGKISAVLEGIGVSASAVVPIILAIVVAIKVIKAVIDDIKKTCEAVIKVAKKMAEIFTRMMTAVLKAFGSAGQLAVKAFGKALEGVYNTAKKLANIFEFDFQNGIDRLYSFSQLNTTGFSSALDGITSNLHALENSLASMASSIYEAFSPVIDAVTDKVLLLTNAVSKMLAQLSGKSSYTKVIKAATEYSKATDSATNSLKRFLLGIDELETVPESDLEEITNSFETVSEALDTASPLTIGANFGQTVADWLDNINWSSIKSKANALGDKFASLLNGIFQTKDLGKKIGSSLAEAVNTAFEYVESFFKTFDGSKFGQFLSDTVAGFFTAIDYAKIHSAITYMIEDIVQTVNTFLQDQARVQAVANGIYQLISNAVEDVKNLVTGIDWHSLALNIGTFLTSALEAIDPQAIVDTFVTLINAALDILTNIPWAKAAEVAMNLINELINGFTEIIQSGKLDEFVEAIIEGVNTLIENLDGGKIAEFINTVIDGIGRIVTKIKDTVDWKKLIDEICEAMASIDWAEAMKVVFEVFASVWVYKNIFKADVFFHLVEGIVDAIKEAFSEKLQEWFGIGEDLANGIVEGITYVLKMANPFYWLYEGAKAVVMAIKSLFTGTYWTDNMGWTSYGNSTSVKAYASGGVVTRPTLAMVGEYANANSNPEIITPESKMRDIFNQSNSDLADTYIQVGRQIIQAIEAQNLEVKIGDDTIARSAARGNNAYIRQTGKALIGA